MFRVSSTESNFIPPLYFDLFHLPFWSVYSFWWTLLTIKRLKQKVESSLSHKKHEVFYVGCAVQVKAVLLLQPLNLKQYCPFRCILSVLVCPVTLIAQKKISLCCHWMSHLLLRNGGRMCVRKVLCVYSWSSGVRFLTKHCGVYMCDTKLFMDLACVWKRNKDASQDTQTRSLFNSHANKVGGNTHHEW